MLRFILNILIIGTFTANTLLAENVDNLMATANKSYTEGKFDDAIKTYELAVRLGYNSDVLYFNLGNAYYKMKNIPAAILNYERANLLNPQDEDITFNLDLARTFTVDRIEPLPEFFMVKFFRNFQQVMSTNSWAYIGVLFLVIALTLAGIFWFTPNSSYKRISFSTGLVALFVTILSFTFSSQQKNLITNHSYGILFPSVVAVKTSPGESGKDFFVLHAGTKVKILDSVGDWLEIRIADGNKGWVLKDTLERI